MNALLLAPDEPLSPELVLVFPPALRAQALARLPVPVQAAPRLRAVAVPPPADDRAARPLGRVLVFRATQLALIFVAITAVTLAMAIVAHAVR